MRFIPSSYFNLADRRIRMRFIEKWLRPYQNTIGRITQEYKRHPEATVDRCSRCSCCARSSLRIVTFPARKQASISNYLTILRYLSAKHKDSRLRPFVSRHIYPLGARYATMLNSGRFAGMNRKYCSGCCSMSLHLPNARYTLQRSMRVRMLPFVQCLPNGHGG